MGVAMLKPFTRPWSCLPRDRQGEPRQVGGVPNSALDSALALALALARLLAGLLRLLLPGILARLLILLVRLAALPALLRLALVVWFI
jgi:hypothetical protein